MLLPRGYQRFYTVKSVTYIISTLGNFEITKSKATKTSILLIGGLGTSTKHSLFSQIRTNSTISKHRMFVFALCACLVPVKLTYCQYKLFPFLVKSFPAFSGHTESRDLICIRHTYQNDKICKPIGLPKCYDIRTKALENRSPPGFLGERTDGPMP